jgi:NADH-quinone oxidoreductase subunit D
MAVSQLRREELLVNMGPQHPSTHGVLRLLLTLDGERIVDCEPIIGYLHSSLEKIAERKTYRQYVTYVDRYDYLNALGNELVYVQAVERLLGIEVPPRCQYIRVMMAEMNRIASHLVYFGTLGLDVGAMTVFLYCFREREVLMDLLEHTTGQRLLYHYLRIGGLRNDLPPGFCEGLREFLRYFPQRIEEYNDLLTRNRIFRARMEGVGVLSAQKAISYACSGPVARGSGLEYDIRKIEGYAVYPELEFDVPTQPYGDAMSRHLVRVEEMRQSVAIVRQCLDKLPKGPIQAEKVPRVIKPPPGEVFERVESPRGELACYVCSDGSEKPYRLHWRGPSFYNLQALPEMVRGHLVADIVAILASIDIVLGDIDR